MTMTTKDDQSMTTIDNITDIQISALRTEAGSAGDADGVAICDKALGESEGPECPLSQVEARAFCAEWISDAEAQ